MVSHFSTKKWLFLLLIPVLFLGFWLRVNNLQHYPPGISNDEAINAIDALNFAQSGNFPMYEEYEGREPLFRIVQAIGLKSFGRSVWALRMVSVLTSMLVIATAMWITQEYLADYPSHIRLIAVFGVGLTIATMAGYITLNRTIYRAVLQHLIMGLSIGFILRGLRLNRWRYFILSGIFGGFALYTYTGAWFYPPAFFILGLALLVLKYREWQEWLPKMLILGLIAAVICLPIVFLLLTNPQSVFGRAEAVSSNNIDWMRRVLILRDLLLVSGDQNPQYNVDLMPVIPKIVQGLFFIGIFALLIRLRQVQTWFLISLLILMAFPALLSNEVLHGLRISSEYLVVSIIVGAGIGLILWIFDKAIKQPKLTSIIGIMCLSVAGIYNANLSWSRYTNYYDNPSDWRLWRVHELELNHNEWFFRVDRQDFGMWVSEQTLPLLVPVEELDRQSTRSWIMNAYPNVVSADRNIIIPDDTQLVVPWSLERGDIMRENRQYALLNDGFITLLPPFTETAHDFLLTNIDSGASIIRDGQIEFLGYTQAIDASQIEFETSDEVNASFGNGDINITGWSGDSTIESNRLEIALEWQAQQRIGHGYISSLQLQTQDYERVTSDDAVIFRWLYPTYAWQTDTPVSTLHQLDISEPLAIGAYQLTIALFYPHAELISAESASQSVIENRVTIAWLKVPQVEPTIPESAHEIEALVIDDLFQLSHIEFAESGNGQLLAQLHWQSIAHRPNIDATIFVHIVDSNNQIVAQSDSRPLDGQYPTFIWDAGETIRTDHVFNFSDFENLDEYSVRVGMYIFPGPQNLPARYQDQPFSDGLVTLGTLTAYFSN